MELNKGLQRPKQFDESRSEFLTAALEIFAEKGFHGSSVDEIVQRAGRSKGGFYHHFQSKVQIYTELFEQMLARAEAKIMTELNSGRSVRDVLYGLIRTYEPMMSDTKSTRASAEFFMLALHNEDAKKMIEQLRRRSIEMFAAFFQKAIDRGEFAADVNAKDLSDLIFASSRGIVLMSAVFDECALLPEKLRKLVNFHLRGVEAAGFL